MAQNFTVIDSYKPTKDTLIRVSKVEGHYVVATYQGDAYLVKNGEPMPGINRSVLVPGSVAHFDTEDSAMQYFLHLIDPEEFPLS